MKKEEVKKLLISLLSVGKNERTNINATKIQKIFFLLQEELHVDLGLTFKAWLFGPYSKELYDVLDELKKEGIVEETPIDIVDPLTGRVVARAREFNLKEKIDNIDVDEKILNFFKEWVKKPREEILEYVYKKYPKYTDNSTIREKILGSGS
ncbi:conjugal transfer protein [Acidianus sulfidivorans JP7]|uniref:Conjugal transfer protein n=1 Tax=Acidianus sulfidivorans JP7 TaxID=619593 RepID=A0A2U9IQ20_9CREN|nr:type II toxin-antitoxin system antitoxin SocA domain-containing protein [Acidianus sulfidivorans]AWR98093.1 conjugal transfer protein [Acidianus sulfidivorans JP7]